MCHLFSILSYWDKEKEFPSSRRSLEAGGECTLYKRFRYNGMSYKEDMKTCTCLPPIHPLTPLPFSPSPYHSSLLSSHSGLLSFLQLSKAVPSLGHLSYLAFPISSPTSKVATSHTWLLSTCNVVILHLIVLKV